MASRLTAAELAARIPEERFSAVKLSDGSVAGWFPVMLFDDGRKSLVLERPGRWAWKADRTGTSQLHGFQSPAIIGALPLLELDPGSLAEDLTAVAATVGLSVEQLVQSLPGPELVECAFETRSDYWIEKALRWAEQALVPVGPRAALQELVDDSQVRQDLRHRAQRLLAPGGAS